MTRKNSTKKALIASVLSLALCFSMLVGTTFAWFTDSAVSSGNIIKTGTLDVAMSWANGTEDPANATWTDASTGAIFTEDVLWEPGVTQVRHIKIANNGTLALKYTVRIVANGDVSDLAEVIDVYYVEPAAQIEDATDLVAENKKGTLDDVLANLAETGNGDLKKGEADTVTIALKMQETAGNDYQEKSIGASFSIQVLATQLASEEDSFGDQYDADATYPTLTSETVKLDEILDEIVANKPVVLDAGEVQVKVPATVLEALPAGVTGIALAYTEPKVDANTNAVTFEAIELVDQNGEKIDLANNQAAIEVTLPAQTAIAAGKNVVVLHDGVAVASSTVAEGGVISYTANHFCEVTVFEATKVATAAELVEAIANGGNVQLAADITINEKLSVVANTVIYGMGKTITYTGAGDRAIDIPNNADAKVDVAFNNLTVDCKTPYCQRGINYNDDGALVLNGVTVKGDNVTYALNLPGSSDNAVVTINNSALTGNIALNVWGENAVINANGTVFTSVDTADAENYSAVALNNDGTTAANGTVVNIVGGSIIAYDEKGEPSIAVRIGTAAAVVNVSETTEVVGVTREPVAVVTYEGYNEFYSCATLQAAIDQAAKATNSTVKLLKDIELTEAVTVDGTVKLDLNGHNITYNSTTQGEAMITNKGNLTINDTVGTGVINYNYTGAADSSYSKGNYTISNQGTLTVNGGKITIANLSGHAKYPIDNNSTTGDAVLVINGGHLYNYNTSAIRQFCNSTTYKNSVTINGGLIEGYCAIWMQNPGNNTVNASLTVTGGEIRSTAKAYVNGTAKLEEVSSAIYGTIAGNDGAWSADSFVSITGGIINENVDLAEDAPANVTVEGATFNGYVEK